MNFCETFEIFAGELIGINSECRIADKMRRNFIIIFIAITIEESVNILRL